MEFDRQKLEHAFASIGQRAIQDDKLVEIAVYGGSALVLTLPGRPATKVVDAVFQGDVAWLRQVVGVVADEFGWPPDWLNDAVKGFLSANDHAARVLFRTYPSEREPGLRVFVASPRYLFAMKCLAMRVGGVDRMQDRGDIEALGQSIGIKDANEALNIVEEYYPHAQVSPKTRFGIEEIFGLNASKPSKANKP